MISTFTNPAPAKRVSVTLGVENVTVVYPGVNEIGCGKLLIHYSPGTLCVETYSLKDFVDSFRRQGLSKEALCQAIHDGIQSSCRPKKLKVEFKVNTPAGERTVL